MIVSTLRIQTYILTCASLKEINLQYFRRHMIDADTYCTQKGAFVYDQI